MNSLPPSLIAAWRSRLAAAHSPQSSESGHASLEQLISGNRLRLGRLVELLGSERGAGAVSIALNVAREVCRDGRPLVVIDRSGEFYPPAAARAGIDLQRTLILRPASMADEAWALDQTLRASGIGCVVAWTQQSSRVMRRLQLAVEQSQGLGLLLRPLRVRNEPCWAEARLLVRTLPTRASPTSGGRRLLIERLRGRGAAEVTSIEIELAHEAHSLPVVSQLAATTQGGRGLRRAQ